MTQPGDAGKSPTECFYGREPDQDLELWKHHASFGGEDKNRMVIVSTWLLGGSAAILWYIWTKLICFDPLGFEEPLRAMGATILGLLLSALAAYVTLVYGGYSNRNWEKAEQIAYRRGWNDLLPTQTDTPSTGLNEIARKWARPCKPESELAPIFIVFFVSAGLLFVVHCIVFGITVMEHNMPLANDWTSVASLFITSVLAVAIFLLSTRFNKKAEERARKYNTINFVSEHFNIIDDAISQKIAAEGETTSYEYSYINDNKNIEGFVFKMLNAYAAIGAATRHNLIDVNIVADLRRDAILTTWENYKGYIKKYRKTGPKKEEAWIDVEWLASQKVIKDINADS